MSGGVQTFQTGDIVECIVGSAYLRAGELYEVIPGGYDGRIVVKEANKRASWSYVSSQYYKPSRFRLKTAEEDKPWWRDEP